MRKARCDLDLAYKPFGAERGGEFGPQHLHGHLALVLQVLGEIDRRHAASADLFLDGVAVGEGGFEAVKKVRHCVLALLVTVLEYGCGRHVTRPSGCPTDDSPTSFEAWRSPVAHLNGVSVLR